MATNTYSRGDFEIKVHKKRIGSFNKYCTQLCKQSLITGFPVIASTRNLLRKIIKVLVFVGCTCGFLYQTSEFLNLYRAYPTMVDIEVDTPAEVDISALSFCNANRIRRDELCSKTPQDCSYYNNITEICTELPKYCPKPVNPANIIMGIPLFLAYERRNRSREYVQNLGERLEDFMAECTVKTRVQQPCKNHVEVSWVDSKGLPHNCFTVESLWGLPQKEARKMPLSGRISLYLKPQPEQYLLYFDIVLVHILMHEAHSLVNPFKEGLAMEVGKTYNIFINQRVTERLPAPYQTNCTDYLKLWKKNGGYGPLTRKACTEQCKMENMLETDGCVAQSISYPENYIICDDDEKYPSDDLVKKCSLQCNDACREVSYTLYQELAYDQTVKCNGDENCMYKDIFLNFIFNRLEVEKFLHQPRFEDVEMFSYIGGYMGMWLGISLVSLFDFLETLVSLASYTCRNKKQKKPVLIC
ncbi:degenerin mec-4-like [Argiope bruennichi]|uniref:degenerin mec-4-like n=1 Tax=Argiope bruennichi TaxID=94029 RepID=UPI002494DB09|nr:degenerin mec-4-like [Argiope bruennichi]